MYKRAVLSVITALALLHTSYQTTYASNSIWDYLFSAPSIFKSLNDHKVNLFSYIDRLNSLSDSSVLGIEDQYDEGGKEFEELPELANLISPSPTVIPTSPPVKPTDTPVHTDTSTGSNSFILSQINQYRTTNGLSPASTDPRTCSFALLRANEISKNFSHSGFTSRRDSSSLPYPSWTKATENIAMNSDYRQVFITWKNSLGHSANMLQDTPYICVRSVGNFHAMEGWRP